MPGRTMEAKPSDSPSESSPEVDLSSAAGSILASINALLDRVGIPAQPITSFEELRKSASSMFVAIFEAMFQVRQKGVVRKPAHVHNYVHNAQVVIDALAGPILNIDLSHITGEAIVRGDTMAIRNLLDVFMCISTVVLKRRVQEEQVCINQPHFGRCPSAWLQSTPAAGKAWPMSVQRQRPRALRPGGHGPLHLHLGEASRSIPGQPSLGSRMRSKRSGRGTPGPRQVHAKDGGRHVAVDAKASAAAAGPADEAKVGVSGGAQLSALELSAHDLGEGEEQPDAARNGIKGPGEDSGDSAPEPHSEEQVEYAGVGEQPLREADLDLRVEEEEEEEDERQAHLPMHLHLEEGGEEGQGGRTSPGFVWRNKLEPEDERELRARLHYQRVLNDRLSALRKRELLDARKHQLGHKNAKHLHRVRQVKRERMAERLHLGSLSMRMQDQTQAQDRVGHIYKKILTALHRQRKEDDREDAARLRAMHLAWRAQADDLERFFNDRVSMVLEHERQSGRQRAQAMRAEERVLAGLLKKMEQDYEKRLARQIESEVVADKVQARRKAEAEHMYRELLKVEDWSANGKDRFMGFRPKANFEQGIKQVRARADSARLEHKRNKQRRNLARAYGT